jgi:hypothetical protein
MRTFDGTQLPGAAAFAGRVYKALTMTAEGGTDRSRLRGADTMRIQGPNSAALAPGAQAARRTAGGSFRLTEEEAARPQGQAPALRTVGGIDALIALQGVDEKTERRRRSVVRGRAALDALDELKIALLSGNPGPATLNRLRSLSESLKEQSGEAGLDGVLAEIEVRLEVEIAKLTPR